MSKIMVVEDDEVLRGELLELLKNEGYETEAITEYKRTAQKVISSDADLVLLDINILELNGELVLRQVRKESDISGNGAVLTGDGTLKYRDAVVNPAKGTISLNDNALTVNISRLRAKLSDFGYTEAIETRKKQGYCLVY